MKAIKMATFVWMKLIVISITFAAVTSLKATESNIIWGINGHPFTAYPGLTLELQIDAIKDLGLSHYRVNISSESSLDDLRKLIQLGKQRSITILPLLTPSLDLAKETTQDLYKKAFAFALNVVAPLQNDIRVWELGNELENYAILQPCEIMDDGSQYNCAWGPASGVGANEYHGGRWSKVSAVLKGLSDGVISIDPSLHKAMGTAGWGHIGAFERMRNDGIQWDISVWHFYGDDPEWGIKRVAEFGKPIWVTEFNHPLGSQNGVVAQAQGLLKMMRRFHDLEKQYRIEAVFIYELFDESYWLPDFEAVMGLLYLVKDGNSWKSDGAKPAHCAVKTLLKGGFRLQYSPDRQVKKLATPEQRLAPFVKRDCDLCLLDNRDGSSEGKLAYAFCLILGRPLDGGGRESWKVEMDKGASFQDILKRLMASPEFEMRFSNTAMNNAMYVKFLYRLLLDRDVDGRGFNDYVSALTKSEKSRTDLARDIISSDEFAEVHSIVRAQSRTVTPVRFKN